MSTEILVSLADRINAEHLAAVTHANQAVDHARRCGELLNETRPHLAHGEWLPWLADHCCVSQRQAWAYMKLAERWGEIESKLEPGSNLSIKGALRLLSPPEEADNPPPQQLTVAENLAGPIQLYLRAGAINEGHAWQLFRLEEAYGDLVTEFTPSECDFRKGRDVWGLLHMDLRPEDNPVCWFWDLFSSDESPPEILAAGCAAFMELARRSDYRVPQWIVAAFWWASVVAYDPRITPIMLADKLKSWEKRFVSAIFYVNCHREEPDYKDQKADWLEWWGYCSDLYHSNAMPIIEDPQHEEALNTACCKMDPQFRDLSSACQPGGEMHDEYVGLRDSHGH